MLQYENEFIARWKERYNKEMFMACVLESLNVVEAMDAKGEVT